MMNSSMARQPEPEPMDIAEEAAAYAEADFAEVNTRFVQRLIDQAGARDDALALDLGTGPGDIPARVLRQCPAWRIVAADLSMPMLAYARDAARNRHVAGALYPLCADAGKMPFPDATFDVIFSNSILHHISDVARFWAEVKRVAKPGGQSLLRDLARPATPEDAAALVRQYAATESPLLQEEFYRSLLAAYTPPEVRRQLDEAGLHHWKVERVSDRHLDVFGEMECAEVKRA